MDASLFDPKNLKRLCHDFHLLPSKAYGQHFLISHAPIHKLIAAAALSPDDTVVEIGPGFGVLTLALAPLVKRVIAFEIEKKLQPYWGEKLKEFGNIEIVWGNAVKKFSVFSFQFSNDYKVVANLPYQITSPLLRFFLESEHKPQKIVVMIQREVAERICARPGEMSLLSVAVQYYGVPKIIADVGKGNFWPAPEVDSAILCINTSTPQPDNTMDEEFFRVVKAGFSHKRKQLWRNLSAGLKLDPKAVKETVKMITGNDKARAEELSTSEWRQLTAVWR